MKVDIEIKITPDPDKDGTAKETETCSIVVNCSPGFGKMLPGMDGLADIGKSYMREKLNSDPIYHPEHFGGLQ